MLETCLFVEKNLHGRAPEENSLGKDTSGSLSKLQINSGCNIRKITLNKILVPLCKKHEVFGGVCWRGIRGERVSVSRLTYAAVSVLTISSGSST